MLFEGHTRKPPSLVDLCVRKAIDNVKYIGYVGGVDFHLLEQIMQHCTLEQLKHIEDSTQDTDLSPVTDNFWKGFYEKHFGEEALNDTMEGMKRNKVNFKWRDLYEAKVISVQEKEKEVVDRLKQRYKNEDERKQSRQTKVCSKAPPSKRPFWGNTASGYNLGHVKSNIMKKAKIDLLKSQEVKNLTAIKRNTIHKSSSVPTPKRTGLSANAPSTSRSIPYGGRNLTETKRNTIQKSFSISAPKRTGLTVNSPPISRSIPSGGQRLPPRKMNSVPGTAPSTSKNAASRQKNM
ncbi:PREDICTED: transcription elongation factor B polypeptide 3-like isoform X2 [Camelina sativa]|nr:PREDICTED: transcription elongation factor B polypeptide 3-like isoform X2 [Camelina sativa]